MLACVCDLVLCPSSAAHAILSVGRHGRLSRPSWVVCCSCVQRIFKVSTAASTGQTLTHTRQLATGRFKRLSKHNGPF